MEAVQKTPEREAFYRKIDGENLSALWNVMGDLITPEPRSACRPHLWKFDSIRDYMTEAGKLITAKEAERRVLVLENPGLRGQSKVTTSLFAGVQMVVPGDVAPAHRHSQSALRFVLEGKGAHTAVDGERTAMEPGDFVITPSMTWHDHSNETNEPMFWLDGLDIPMVQFFDASFAEGSNEDQQKITRPAGDSFARYGHNLLPVDEKRSSKTSPIFSYPYSHTREALEQAKARNEWDACHGLKLKFSNPETGDFAMPTIGTFIQLLPLLILWLGIGEEPKIATIALGVFFSTAISVYSGVDAVPRNLIRMAQSFNVPFHAIVFRVIWPGALPSILAGFRITASVALLLVVSAEMIGAQFGIGAFVLQAGNLMQTDQLLAGVVILSLFGLAVGKLINVLEARLLHWR